MKTPTLDEVIHAPKRLKICAYLAPLEEAEFQILREHLGVSDSVLSKHISRLQEAGYVRLRKSALGGRQRTWALMTARGRRAFSRHVSALAQILELSAIDEES